MNRSDFLHATQPCLTYSNLEMYRSHSGPRYGKGVKAPIWSATPMYTAFARGNCDQPKVEGQRMPCNAYCDSHVKGYAYFAETDKMMRRKKM
jgi:hypothetical protein